MQLRLPDVGLRDVADEASGSEEGADLAAGFASVLAQMHQRMGGTTAHAAIIGQVGMAVSQSASAGHSCLPLGVLYAQLASIAGETQMASETAIAEVLLASPVVGSPAFETEPGHAIEAHHVLVIDRQRVYLQRYWRYETHLASRLAILDRLEPLTEGLPLHHGLAQYFVAGQSPNWQQVAAATVLTRGISVITGGPGTGKTHTVARLLAVLLGLAPDQRVALAAPTGKAALRLEQLIGREMERLGLAEAWPALRAQTVHRLLGARPGSTHYRYHAERTLPYDLVIVDEASMLDLALAGKLFDAMPLTGRVVLLGDADQLASVETGAVFAGLASLGGRDQDFAQTLGVLCDASPTALVEQQTPAEGVMHNAVVRLTESFRYLQDGAIGRSANAVREGDFDRFESILAEDRAELRWCELAAERDVEQLAAVLFDGFADLIRAIEQVATDSASVAKVLALLPHYGVLCGLRHGPHGVLRLNLALGRLMAARCHVSAHEVWFTGRMVMVTQNDPMLKLFNGDIGIALSMAGELMVYFDHPNGLRAIAPGRLPLCASAFALTIHQSQGSEFDHVDIILPGAASPLASRELLYTAITRARQSVRLWAEPGALKAALQQPTKRYSALAERLHAKKKA